MNARPPLRLTLAAPRGFCAGVDRAVKIVERSLERFGAPVYVRHEIVHNRRVVKGLEARGARFVDELDEVPDGAMVIFSAHGVAKAIPAEAEARGLASLDATCPLVSKVHAETARHHAAGRHILLIGHAGHPEVAGTLGQVPEGVISLIETAEDARNFTPPADTPLAYATQTTLSIDDTAEIIDILQERFPDIAAPPSCDICYATTNRQNAVKELAGAVEHILVIGAENSSNSQRLVEIARASGCAATLIGGADDIDWARIAACRHIGLTAGASAPEEIVEEVIAAAEARFDLARDEMKHEAENIRFNLPRTLRDAS